MHNSNGRTIMAIAGETELSELAARPETFLRVPVGVMSPLWGLFAGAAVTGATWWWMTRWARPANLEAFFGATDKAEEALGAEVEAVVQAAAPTIEAAVAPVEAAAEPLIESVAEASESVVEAVAKPAEDLALVAATEAAMPLDPVGGEAAPISPVLEAVERIEADPTPAIEAEPAARAPKPKKSATPKKA
jgi:hypothetical protein